MGRVGAAGRPATLSRAGVDLKIVDPIGRIGGLQSPGGAASADKLTPEVTVSLFTWKDASAEPVNALLDTMCANCSEPWKAASHIVSECTCAQRAQPSSPLGTCHLQIACLYNHHSAFLDLSSLVFCARGLLQCTPVLVKESKVSVFLRSMLNIIEIIERCMCDQNGDDCWTVEHAEPHAPYAFPRWVAKR
jgi:hypothetical protein